MNNEKLDAVLNGNLRISNHLADLTNQIKTELLKNPDNQFLRNLSVDLMNVRIDLANLNIDTVEVFGNSDEKLKQVANSNLVEARNARNFVQQEISSLVSNEELKR